MSEKQNQDIEMAEYTRRFRERVRQSARLHRAMPWTSGHPLTAPAEQDAAAGKRVDERSGDREVSEKSLKMGSYQFPRIRNKRRRPGCGTPGPLGMEGTTETAPSKAVGRILAGGRE